MRLGVDVGGTKTAAVVLDGDGRTVARHRVPTERGERVVDSVLAAGHGALARAGALVAELQGVGIGVPGQVDRDRSSLRNAVHLGLDDFDLGAAVRARLGVAATVENDVNAAVVGARHLLRAARLVPSAVGGPAPLPETPLRDVVYLGLGTGIAAGIALDGAMHRGATGVAGEIGHVPVPGASARCRCGQVGCLETVAAGWALAERWPGPRPAAAMLAAAVRGDDRGVRERDAFVEALAHAVRMLVLALDVDTVAIGGGISELGEPLLDAVRDRLDAWGADSPFLASLAIPARLRLVPPEGEPAAVGAALLAPASAG